MTDQIIFIATMAGMVPIYLALVMVAVELFRNWSRK